MNELNDAERLSRIAQIIEQCDHRAMCVDGPVTPTLDEMTESEIQEIYALAKRQAPNWRPNAN